MKAQIRESSLSGFKTLTGLIVWKILNRKLAVGCISP